MKIEERIHAFSTLGAKIKALGEDETHELATIARSKNGWFDFENVNRALVGLAYLLEKDKLTKWTSAYDLKPQVPRIVGIIMAGNIPFVGFHDLLSVLISGHFAAIKLSSQDSFLMQKIIEWINELEPRFKRNIEFKEKLDTVDAVICTGSDNTARYFEYYFGKYPNIIRKNRTSLAVLDGHESEKELIAFGEDVYSYFGLGCRNVSKLLIPEDYDVTRIFPPLQGFEHVIHHHKYRNNYDYNKAIYLVNKEEHLDNGFLLLKESDEMVSPTSVLFFQRYKSKEDLNRILKENQEKIQCIVGHNFIRFGQAQSPEPWDYADGVDTLKFLQSID